MDLWKKIDLNADNDDDNEEQKEQEDILWLYELWYMQLKFLMKQPKKQWYFSREFFDVFMRRNPLIVWKLIYDAFGKFEICKNAWSQAQLFVMMGNMNEYCKLEGDEDEVMIKCILKGMALRIVNPLKECLGKAMDPIKKMLIAKNAGIFMRRLNKYKIDDKVKKEISDVLGNSKLQWKKTKSKKKSIKKKKTEKKSVKKNDKGKKGRIRKNASYKKKGKQGMKSKKKSNNNTKKRKMNFKDDGNKKVNPNKKRKVN